MQSSFSLLFAYDLRANTLRLSRGKTGAHFPDHAPKTERAAGSMPSGPPGSKSIRDESPPSPGVAILRTLGGCCEVGKHVPCAEQSRALHEGHALKRDCGRAKRNRAYPIVCA